MSNTVILLIGPQGAGKTSFCRSHLPDFFRISQDDQGRQTHLIQFAQAIERNEPRIVIDRINGRRDQRRRYLDLARERGYRTRIIWLNVDRDTCLRRCRARADHPTLAPEDAEQALGRYFDGFQIPSRCEADELQIIGPPPTFEPVADLRERIGERRHIIVGDIHGCFDELIELLTQLRFEPANDVLISVGDIVDRGPKVRETVEFLLALPAFHMVLGNHEDKLLRYLKGNNVKVSGGLETTIAAFGGVFPAALRPFLEAAPLLARTPSGYVVHAGFDPEFSAEEQSRSDCLYMRYYGGRTYFDAINGQLWWTRWPADQPRVFFGHIPAAAGPDLPHVVSLDAGCVFGGRLKAFDSRAGKVHAVSARHAYALSDTPLSTAAAAGPAVVIGPGKVHESLQRREEYVRNGLLRVDRSDDGRLAIYTYTDQCVYDSAWDDLTLNSRGHIFDVHTGECLAWPFSKFFNLGENKRSLPGEFDWQRPFDIYEKMDGWLGVLYRDEGSFKVATRGSFHSTGARWASAFVQSLDLSCLPEEATLCFEIIHPQHKIILNYGDLQSLVVLAAFERHSGREYPREQVQSWTDEIGLPLVNRLDPMSLEELLHSQQQREQCEGFVLRFADGRRVKVKTEWYLRLAHIMSNLSPIAVWETLCDGRVPAEYLIRIPEELRATAEQYQAVLEAAYARRLRSIQELADPLLARFGNDRKGLAMYLDSRREEIGEYRGGVFLLLDGKRQKLDDMIKRMIYPAANRLPD